MKLPPPPGPHFSVDDLLHILYTTQALTPETEARAIHHFALLCPECWAAFDELPPLEDCTPTSITGLGLFRLKSPAEVVPEGTATHRAALAGARTRPLGFCHLLLEEAWLIDRYKVTGGPFSSLPNSCGPIVANGALLDAPREAHDLQAHLLVLFAHAYAYHGAFDLAGETTALARAHVTRGRGEAEPAATVLQLEAEVEYCKGDPSSGRLLFERAREAIEGYEPSDREAEILYHQGLIIGVLHPDGRTQAAAYFRKALAMLDQLEPGTNPQLRLDLTEELAAMDADTLFYKRLLGEPYDADEGARIQQMVAEQKPLDGQYGAIKGAQRAEMLGKIVVFSDPDRARAAFREAMGHYQEVGDPTAAAKLLRELFYLSARADACGTPWVDLSFLAGIWDLPQAEPFFREVMDEVEARLVTPTAETRLAAELGRLRQAVLTTSQREAQAAERGAKP